MQYVRFYPANFLVDTQGLNGTQTKAYMVALSLYAHHEKPFQNIEDLARAFLMNRVVSRLAQAKKIAEWVLTNFFSFTSLGWVHKEIARQIDCFLEGKKRWVERINTPKTRKNNAQSVQKVRQNCTPVSLKNQRLAVLRESERLRELSPASDFVASPSANAPKSSQLNANNSVALPSVNAPESSLKTQTPTQCENTPPSVSSPPEPPKVIEPPQETPRQKLVRLIHQYLDMAEINEIPNNAGKLLFRDVDKGIELMEYSLNNKIGSYSLSRNIYEIFYTGNLNND